jgi:hypothetical protein
MEMFYKPFIWITLIVFLNSCALKNGIVSSVHMINKPEVLIHQDLVTLTAYSNPYNSAATIYKVKYKISFKDSTVIFCGIDGVKLVGISKNYINIKKSKFKSVDPINFKYYYRNSDNSRIIIEPKN